MSAIFIRTERGAKVHEGTGGNWRGAVGVNVQIDMRGGHDLVQVLSTIKMCPYTRADKIHKSTRRAWASDSVWKEQIEATIYKMRAITQQDNAFRPVPFGSFPLERNSSIEWQVPE